MIRLLGRLANNAERGNALIEWALLVVLIAILALTGVAFSGQEVSGQYSNIASSLESL